MNITFIILGTGYKECYQADIKVYDSCHHLIYDGHSFNGRVKLFLSNNQFYKLYIRLKNKEINTSFYVGYQDKFIFNLIQNDSNTITFLLTDYNYDNLPIMKGEMLFGKNS